MLVGGLFLKIVGADQVFAPVVRHRLRAGLQGGLRRRMGGCVLVLDAGVLRFRRLLIGCARHRQNVRLSSYAAELRRRRLSRIRRLWTRWRISLSNWLRDYGSTRSGHTAGPVRGYLNVMITFTACSFWHSAAWRFVVWGAMHGAFLVGERLLKDSIGDWKIWDAKPGVAAAGAAHLLALFSWAWSKLPRADDPTGIGIAPSPMFGFIKGRAITWNGDVWVFVVALVVGLAGAGLAETAQGLGLAARAGMAVACGAARVDVAGDHAVAGQDQCLHLLSVLGERREQPTLAPDTGCWPQQSRLGGWFAFEKYWRTQGYAPTVMDSLDLWSQHRARAVKPAPPQRIALLGASAHPVRFSPAVFRDEALKMGLNVDPIMLAVNGHYRSPRCVIWPTIKRSPAPSSSAAIRAAWTARCGRCRQSRSALSPRLEPVARGAPASAHPRAGACDCGPTGLCLSSR